jgi:hypothetical protein
LVQELQAKNLVPSDGIFNIRPFLEQEKIAYNMTYADYFSAAFFTPILNIDMNKPMDIVFVTASKNRYDKIWDGVKTGAAVGGGAGFLTPVPGMAATGASLGAVGGFFFGAAKSVFGGVDYYSGLAVASAESVPCRKLY